MDIVNKEVELNEVETTTVPETEAQPTAKSKWEKFKARLDTIICIMLVALAAYCVCGYIGQTKTGELFYPFGYRAVKILSGSMEDALETGAVVIVKQTKDVEQNDIIFFITEEGSPVIHRYISNTPSGDIITKGDANPKEDLAPVTTDQLQGEVVFIMNWFSKFA